MKKREKVGVLSSGKEGITPIGLRNRKMGVLRYRVLLSFASAPVGGGGDYFVEGVFCGLMQS